MITNLEQVTYIIRGRGEGKTQALLQQAYNGIQNGYDVYYWPHSNYSDTRLRNFRLDYENIYKRSCPIKSLEEIHREVVNKPIIVLIDNLDLFDNISAVYNDLCSLITNYKVENIYITITGKVG